ncbi:MAG: hypothetical protein KAW09_05850, partial [Thermoplasmata archaeon]|nr:hypothetical protein [Thermoplasmata archaeon]
FFRKVRGETHHVMRYEKYPKLIAIGVLPKSNQESESTFKKLASRNAINYASPKNATGIIYDGQSQDDIKEIVKGLLNEVGVRA